MCWLEQFSFFIFYDFIAFAEYAPLKPKKRDTKEDMSDAIFLARKKRGKNRSDEDEDDDDVEDETEGEQKKVGSLFFAVFVCLFSSFWLTDYRKATLFLKMMTSTPPCKVLVC